MHTTLHNLHTTCLVIGGGPAGYGAAMAAQRGGCQTLLAERHGFLGGMGTAAGLSCHLNHRYSSGDLSGAVYREFVRIQDDRGLHYYDTLAQADFFEPEECKRVMEATLLEAGVTLLFHSLLLSVARDGEGWLVLFAGKGAHVSVSCRYLIDTTGDGDACTLAGAGMTHGRRSDGLTQPMSMVVQMGGFDPQAWSRAGFRLVAGRYATEGDSFGREIALARRKGRWSIPRENIALFWAMPSDPTRVTVNGTRINGFSACNPLETTLAEVEGRRQAAELVDFFREHVPGFGRAYLLQTGPQIGVRESRRIVGRETLHEEQVRSCHLPESSVVFCAYPIDVHHPDGSGTQFETTGRGSVYGIPWGCCLPDGIEHLVAAGRCISATHEAAGSFRVMPTCMTIGEAAGTAVALSSETRRPLSALHGKDIRARMNAALLAQGGTSPDTLFDLSVEVPACERSLPA